MDVSKTSAHPYRDYGAGQSFSVSNRVAAALQNALDEIISILLISDNGETIDSEIGKGTVEAWKTIYGVEAIAENP